MKLKVPVNSYESAVTQIAAGADEIYMGLEDTFFQRMSFSARARVTAHGVHANFTEEEFARTAAYAHAHQVTVIFTVNCQHVANSPGDFYREAYLSYVRRGIELGADALIVADVGNLLSLRRHGIDAPIIGGSYLGIFNSETVALLRELGVFRVCLPDQIRINEIRSIKEKTDLEVELFIGYGCANLSGSCRFCHNNGERMRVGVTCRADFQTQRYGAGSVLDVCTDCAICSIPALLELDIDSLKLVGREANCVEAAKITAMYKAAITSCAGTGTLNKSDIVSVIPWWEEEMCPTRCKYGNSGILDSYL